MYNEPVVTLGTSAEQAGLFASLARADGLEVKSESVWTGPIPERGSYEILNPFMRMSTPEFFFLRKANELEPEDALLMGCELVSHFRTNLTAHNMGDGEIDVLDNPRTTVERLDEYLEQVKDTPEGKRALELLERVKDCIDEFETVVGMSLMAQLFDF